MSTDKIIIDKTTRLAKQEVAGRSSLRDYFPHKQPFPHFIEAGRPSGIDIPSLPTKITVTHVTSLEQRKAIIKNNLVVVIDYYTKWCGPCKAIKPKFEELANEYKGKCFFAKEDVEDRFGEHPPIRGVPCFHVYVNGVIKPDATCVGSNMQKLKDTIDNIFNKSDDS